MLSSRLLVGVVLLAVLAGCAGGPASDAGSTTTTDDPQTTTPTARPPDPGESGTYNSFSFRASPASPADVARALATPVDRADERGRDTARTLVENGSVVATVVEPADDGVIPSDGPLEVGGLVRDDGVVYRVDGEVRDRTEGEGYRIEVDGPLRPSEDEYDTAEEQAVAVENLSTAERRAFEFVLPDGFDPESGAVIVGRRYLPPSGESLSDSPWTDGDPAYVRQGEHRYRVQVEDRTRLVRATVRYEVKTVAESLAAFGHERQSDVVTNVTASTPPAPARSVLLNVTEEGVVEWEGTVQTRPERVKAAGDWIRRHPPESSVAFLRYRDDLYRITVREAIE